VADCSVKNGEVVVVGDATRPDDCTLEQGAKLRFLLKPEEAGEQHGAVSPPSVMLPPASAPPPTEARPKMDPTTPVPAPTAAPATPASPVVAEPAALAQEAHTEQPSSPSAPTPAELGTLVEQGGGGMTGIMLAVIAVAGGGAAWKFYSQRSEQQHELAKEKLKMESAAQGLGGAQPPPCQAANTAIEQKLSALNQRVEAAEAPVAIWRTNDLD
jgi:hypothetical protein